MDTDNLIVVDPEGVLVAGTRYPQGTRVGDIQGKSDAHVRAWKRFKQIAEPTIENVKGKQPSRSKKEEGEES